MPKWIEKWKVPRSSGEGTWTVSRAEDGTWGCSCPRWKFRREQCHHIQAVQANPSAHEEGSPSLPEIVPGYVEAVEIVEGVCLHPLIPLNQWSTDVLATIVYDLLELGYSFGVIKDRFRMIPKEWRVDAVRTHVQRWGRVLCREIRTGTDRVGVDYVRVPVSPDKKTGSGKPVLPTRGASR